MYKVLTETDIFKAVYNASNAALGFFGWIFLIAFFFFLVSGALASMILILKAKSYLSGFKKENYVDLKWLVRFLDLPLIFFAVMFVWDATEILLFKYFDFGPILLLLLCAAEIVLGMYALLIRQKAKKHYSYFYLKNQREQRATVAEIMKMYPTNDEYNAQQEQKEAQTEGSSDISEALGMPSVYGKTEDLPVLGSNSSVPEQKAVLEDFNFGRLKLDSGEEQPTKPCPYCGTANAEDREDCVFCGAKL